MHDSEGFVTPIPPGAGATWSGLEWHRLGVAQQLAHVRSVTRWSGGFVATGDLLVAGDSARSKVWVSDDGATWNPVPRDVFGPDSIVVGVAPIVDGVLVFTLQGAGQVGGEPTWAGTRRLTGPWQSWTSSDGRTWTAHPGPDFELPRSMLFYGQDEYWYNTPSLLAGAGSGVVALVLGSHPLAFTRDGVTWETASLDSFPGGPTGWTPHSLVAFPPGFLAVGYAGAEPVALASADGHTWKASALPASCPLGYLLAGPAGLILAGREADPGGDKHADSAVWCSSLDGRTWRRLEAYSPLGVFPGGDGAGRGPDGIILADGERLLAYRGYPKQAAWTSFDGRMWQPVNTLSVHLKGWGGIDGYSLTPLLTPIGFLLYSTKDGSAWYGAPET